MILGYTLSGKSSNEAIFFHEKKAQDILCPNCGSCLNYDYCPKSIEIKPSKKYDVAYTHDLRLLYSEGFVEFCRHTLKSNEVFQPIQAGSVNLYYMMPSKILAFDTERRKTTFTKPCGQCGGYESITGAYPAYLKTQDHVGTGFFRTDIGFASLKEKHPLIVIGVRWKELIAAQKFRGFSFEAINS
jgi:hypothetical protein